MPIIFRAVDTSWMNYKLLEVKTRDTIAMSVALAKFIEIQLVFPHEIVLP